MGGSADEFPLLAAHGLYAADTAGNGNCLFNALSDQINGTQSLHHEIRSRVIEYLRENRDLYKHFVDVHPGGGVRRNPKRKNAGAYATPSDCTPPTEAEINQTFENHLRQMARGGTYGDNMEIVAFCEAYGVDVKIYQRDFAYMAHGNGDEGERPIAHIAYHTWEHYSSVRNIKGPHTGLPHVSPTSLSAAAEQKIQEQAAGAFRVAPWMIKVVVQSLPHFADRALIHKTLEECKGNVDHAVTRLLDAEERGSVSSAQGSSSVEREADSDDDTFSGPNKKQDRRMSRATRAAAKDKDDAAKSDLAHRPKRPATSAEAIVPLPAEARADAVRDDGLGGPEGGWRNDATHSDLDSPYASASEQSSSSQPRIGGVRLRLSQPKRESDVDLPSPDPGSHVGEGSRGGRTQQRQIAPKPKRGAVRAKQDLKKAAQKAAAKERKQAMATGKPANGKSGTVAILLKKDKENAPIIETGIKTLYI